MQLSDRIGRRISLQDLHVLMAVVQAGSMNKAAALLNTGQSAISRSIAELERNMGVRLLDRSSHGIAPTESGRALIAGGAAMFDELRQAVKNIEFLADPTAGEVRIGSVIPLAASFVYAVIDQLSRHHPRIMFHLMTAQQDALQRELNDRNVDLLVAWKQADAEERLAFEFLYDDRYVVVAGAQNPWTRRSKIELSELVSEAWTLPPPDSVLGAATVEAFRSRGLDCPRPTVVAIPGEVRTKLLATGRFLTIFPVSALRLSSDSPKLKVLPVELPLARLPVGIVTLKDRTLSPVARIFIEHAREVAKPLKKRQRLADVR